MTLPLFPVTTVGSWPRPPELVRLQTLWRQGRVDRATVERAADQAVREVVQRQLDAGVDLVTDGEQRRDNFYSFVADKLDGVRLTTLGELLDLVEDRPSFEKLLETLDVPASAIANPTCVGPIRRREPLALEEFRFVRTLTDRPIKITLPGPYLLARAMFVPEVTRAVYPTEEALAEDVVAVLRAEIADLERAGAAFIQLDEPVLTELVFTQGRTRTFMCATLAARRDPTEELTFAVSLINRVVEAASRARIGLHVCRGNWSRNEATLLRGSYAPLAPVFAALKVRQLVLEYATERAGDLLRFGEKEIGLGVVNPRTDEVEPPGLIRARVERALQLYPPERVFLNPDCGFGTFSRRPVATAAIATRKLAAIAEAARALRAEFARSATAPRS